LDNLFQLDELRIQNLEQFIQIKEYFIILCFWKHLPNFEIKIKLINLYLEMIE